MTERTTITITGLTADQVAGQVAREVMYGQDGYATPFKERIEAIVEERVRTWVDAEIEKLGGGAIEKAVAAVLAEGWQETNRYGEATGKRMTLKERIASMIVEPIGDYNGKGPRMQKIAEDVLTKAIHSEFGKEIETGRARLRAAVDDVIKAKLTETLKSALGLR